MCQREGEIRERIGREYVFWGMVCALGRARGTVWRACGGGEVQKGRHAGGAWRLERVRGGGLWRVRSGADDFHGAAVEGEDVYAGHGERYVGGRTGVECEAGYGAQLHESAAGAADTERAVGRDPCGAAVRRGGAVACAVLTEEGGEEGVARDGERQRVVREREAETVPITLSQRNVTVKVSGVTGAAGAKWAVSTVSRVTMMSRGLAVTLSLQRAKR